MPERFQEYATILLFALAAISGGLGGCSVAAQHLISGKHRTRLAYFLAYAIIGSVFGLLTAAYGAFLVDESVTDIIGPSIIAGAIGAASLSGMNITARFLLQRLGVEITVDVRRQKRGRRNGRAIS